MKLRCIDRGHSLEIKVGQIYEGSEADGGGYMVTGHGVNDCWFFEHRFEVVEETPYRLKQIKCKTCPSDSMEIQVDCANEVLLTMFNTNMGAQAAGTTRLTSLVLDKTRATLLRDALTEYIDNED